jgi:glycosyltransferase involved in cell wall biosynthesis
MRLLMLGPALEVRGGISALERMVLEHLPRRIAATHIPTMVEGSKAAKLHAFLRALALAWKCTGDRPVVHIHFASRASSVRKMSLARLALARGCRVVMHAHGGAYQAYWDSLSPRARQGVARVLGAADALIVLGERWRQFFASIGVGGERIAVLPNPVVLPRALPPRPRGGPARFVYLGLVSRDKGAFDLVEALARLPAATRARLRVVIAGNGEHEALRGRIAHHRLGAEVELRGWVERAERDALLAGAESFVLPSYHEGLPMALLEAMAWGLAPLCTPVGAIPELLEHEANALLVAPGDIDALAAALGRLALDAQLRLRLGAAARERVEPLALERYMERLCGLYDAVSCRS